MEAPASPAQRDSPAKRIQQIPNHSRLSSGAAGHHARGKSAALQPCDERVYLWDWGAVLRKCDEVGCGSESRFAACVRRRRDQLQRDELQVDARRRLARSSSLRNALCASAGTEDTTVPATTTTATTTTTLSIAMPRSEALERALLCLSPLPTPPIALHDTLPADRPSRHPAAAAAAAMG